MGFLGALAAGAADGLAAGMSGYGQAVMRDAQADEKQRDKLEYDKMHQQLMAERVANARASAGGGGAGKDYIGDLYRFADDVGAGKSGALNAMRMGGMAPEQVSDMPALVRGEKPQVALNPATPMDDEGNVNQTQAVKYTAEQAQAVVNAGRDAWTRAMSAARPDMADDIAKGQMSAEQLKLLKAYQGGDKAAGDALMASKGVKPYEGGSRAVDGTVVSGSKAEAAVKKDGALADAAGARASKDNRTDPNLRAPRGGGGAPKEDKTLKDLIATAEQDVDNAQKTLDKAKRADRDDAKAALAAAKAAKAELVARRSAALAPAPTKAPALAVGRPGQASVSTSNTRPALADIFKR